MAGEIETAKAAGIPVVNGFKAISEIPDTDTDTPAAAEDSDDIGDVTLHLPAPAGTGPIHVTIDGGIILDIAEKLRADPGAHFDIGGGE